MPLCPAPPSTLSTQLRDLYGWGCGKNRCCSCATSFARCSCHSFKPLSGGLEACRFVLGVALGSSDAGIECGVEVRIILPYGSHHGAQVVVGGWCVLGVVANLLESACSCRLPHGGV